MLVSVMCFTDSVTEDFFEFLLILLLKHSEASQVLSFLMI